MSAAGLISLAAARPVGEVRVDIDLDADKAPVVAVDIRVDFEDTQGGPMPGSTTASAEVEALFLYPVKSCAGVRVSELRFDADGRIEGDREWIVVDARGELCWLGSHPKLALLQPKLLPDALLLRGGDLQPLCLAREAAGEATRASIWDPETRRMVAHGARDAGAMAAQFLRELTGEELRLVKLDREALLATAPNPLHAVSSASVEELNAHLVAQGHARVDARRLRPNLVLGGGREPMAPFLEEYLLQLVWPDAAGTWRRLVRRAACERCVVPNVDPDSGEVQPGIDAAIAELSAQRWPGQASRFGIYLQPPQGGTLGEGTAMTMELDF
ncbi:MOSC N-terminal beta barrel domain-containing protein [Mitsuaria sp. GD03876]|uniref:MOSC N-terminal beta barrel domain-containing protein n=1 Tax=Mitsuaria sp. GD03876 TaxID=2975399 RepID=UPI002446A53F|nr:MOSC N-terminal beta barrel domain-containing protein [Mitsuaria sp. GD03876]MDH0867384.1 MOSC N-terminal beta barrel domain-containing protein [Mitsuaria sp. GD03876]